MWKSLFNLFSKDDLLTQALHECYTMLDMDLEMFQASMKALRHTDHSETKIDIYATDKRINQFERDVRRKVLSHLVVSGNSGLSSGLALVSVVIDIERIGDYAKNIYQMAKVHPERLDGGSLDSEIADIEANVDRLFSLTVKAFRESDVESARQVMTGYKGELSARCDTLVDNMIAGKYPEFNAGDASSLALYVRYLKRIAAHSRNITTSIVNPFDRIGYKEKKENGS